MLKITSSLVNTRVSIQLGSPASGDTLMTGDDGFDKMVSFPFN